MRGEIPPEGIDVLFEYDIALRLTEKRFYRPDSRVLLATVPTGIGVDYDTLTLGLAAPAIFAQALPSLGRTDIFYKPFKKRQGEIDKYNILSHYAPSSITPNEQRVFERSLKSIVLADRGDDLDRIRFFPDGTPPVGPHLPLDVMAIAEGLENFYADDRVIKQRLGVPYETRTMSIIPLQIKLTRVKLRSAGFGREEYIFFSSPGLPKDYLAGK